MNTPLKTFPGKEPNKHSEAPVPPGEYKINSGQRLHVSSEDEYASDLTKEMIKRTDRLSDQSIELSIRAKEAREFLDWHTDHVKKTWLDWIEESSKVLESIRQCRVAIGFESKQLLSECADVRKFFLSDDHEKEIRRLREFIELAERLRALKSDGTLDKLADTILKL